MNFLCPGSNRVQSKARRWMGSSFELPPFYPGAFPLNSAGWTYFAGAWLFILARAASATEWHSLLLQADPIAATFAAAPATDIVCFEFFERHSTCPGPAMGWFTLWNCFPTTTARRWRRLFLYFIYFFIGLQGPAGPTELDPRLAANSHDDGDYDDGCRSYLPKRNYIRGLSVSVCTRLYQL